MKTVIIDNYDSFTYNLFQYIAELGHDVTVIRNDKIAAAELETGDYRAIIISPGPGTPDEAGISKDVIRHFAGKVPILGVCLGHQAIGEVFGGRVVRGPIPVHGKASEIKHNGEGLYKGLPQQLVVGRYHSLIVEKETLPDSLEITSETADGIIMGIKHKKYKVEGVQFHPESVLTPDGLKLLKNFFEAI
ncbi:MAG: aminodeoxychorismate/anthranilate synthase component II [Pelosinus sp.]|nr:aminodeoxychorismate/anthranilate synthase component II [Pelosinus sp.]